MRRLASTNRPANPIIYSCTSSEALTADHGVERWIVHHRVDALNEVLVWLTRIGSHGAVWIALAIALALVHRRRAILWTVPVVVAADAIADGIKLAVGRARPHLDPLVSVPGSPSFPSGHTTTAFAGAAMLTAFAPRTAPLLYLLAAAIGYSRLYLGVHWPLDVLGGAVLGTLVAFTSLRLRARFPHRSPAGPRRGRSRSRRRGRPPAAGPPES